jgi:ADP-ribose pyrophosphatase YjhB (NUDIX family)
MVQKPNIVPPVAHLILQREQQILLIHRPNDQRYSGRYDLPADYRTGTEANTAAAVRAAKLELGIEVDPADMEFAAMTQGLHPDGTEHYDFYFRVSHWTGEPRLTSLHRGTEAGWARLDHLPANMTPRTKLGLEISLGGIPYVEYGFDGSPLAARQVNRQFLGGV